MTRPPLLADALDGRGLVVAEVREELEERLEVGGALLDHVPHVAVFPVELVLDRVDARSGAPPVYLRRKYG